MKPPGSLTVPPSDSGTPHITPPSPLPPIPHTTAHTLQTDHKHRASEMDPFAESPPGTPAQEVFDADVSRLRGQFLIGRFQTKNGQHRAETKVSTWMDDIVRPMALGGQLKVVKAAEDDDEDWEDLGGWLEEGNVRMEEEGAGGVEGLARGMAAMEFAEGEGIKEQHEFWEDVEEEKEDEDMIFVDADPEDTGGKVGGEFEETAQADDA